MFPLGVICAYISWGFELKGIGRSQNQKNGCHTPARVLKESKIRCCLCFQVKGKYSEVNLHLSFNWFSSIYKPYLQPCPQSALNWPSPCFWLADYNEGIWHKIHSRPLSHRLSLKGTLFLLILCIFLLNVRCIQVKRNYFPFQSFQLLCKLYFCHYWLP